MELLTQHVEDVIVSIELEDQAVTATLQACVRCGHRAFRTPRSHSRHTPQADPQDLSALFIHEARMALLTRIAQSLEGAFALLHCSMCHCPAIWSVSYCSAPLLHHADIVSRLGNCQYLCVWPPETDGPANSAVMFSTVQGRFQRLLVCSLRLVAAIAATLRVQTRNATYQVRAISSCSRAPWRQESLTAGFCRYRLLTLC
jgi:hypothetical protein